MTARKTTINWHVTAEKLPKPFKMLFILTGDMGIDDVITGIYTETAGFCISGRSYKANKERPLTADEVKAWAYIKVPASM